MRLDEFCHIYEVLEMAASGYSMEILNQKLFEVITF